MLLKPQDILVSLKLVAVGNIARSFKKLAIELSMSPSEVHAACNRVLAARLAIQKDKKILPNIRNLEEFLIHGLKYGFVAERGEMVRGMPSGYAAPPMNSMFVADDEPLPVWPDAEGRVRAWLSHRCINQRQRLPGSTNNYMSYWYLSMPFAGAAHGK